MSVKSKRKKQNRNPLGATPIEILSRQKQTIKQAFWDYLWVSLAFALLALPVLALGLFSEDKAYTQRILFGAVPGLFLIAVGFLWASLRRKQLLNGLRDLRPAPLKEAVVRCEQVSFLIHPYTRGSEKLLCINITDEAGNTYRYIPASNHYFYATAKNTRKSLRERLVGTELHLTCYGDSHFVCSYEPVE